MATRFEPLDLGDPRLFGIRLHGAFGRGDRQRLLDLADRCVVKQKTHLVLDCADLDSLGGGGAAALAYLQRQLMERGGEVVFVAAGEVILRFLQSKFVGLPLRCFATADVAKAALTGEAAVSAEPAAAPEPPDGDAPAPPPAASAADLDHLLEDVPPGRERPDATVRRTADLVTAAYVSLDDVLQAARTSNNPTLLGETLGMLLDCHDLAAATVYCHRHGEHFVATAGKVRLAAEGGIVAALERSRRPLTLMDLEDGDLWDEESQLLEDLQPDLILPLSRRDELYGIAFLRRGAGEREYGISEVFALELLLRLLAAPAPAAADEEPGEAAPVRGDAQQRGKGSRVQPDLPAPVSTGGRETLLNVMLDLARGLQDAQDLPHFWQLFISRLREASEVTSLIYLDAEEQDFPPYLAGEARRGLELDVLRGERIQAFFRTLERPVEIANMPSSLQRARDMLTGRGMQWLAPLRAEGSHHLGIVALGLRWRCRQPEQVEQIQGLMEIAAEALQRLRESQNRADMSLGLLEDLLIGADQTATEVDAVTRETTRAVRVLAAELGLAPDQERDLVLGALLRNHGQQQAGLDDLAADQLTGTEWERYRDHPENGAQRLAALKAPVAVRDAVRHHHERFDGRGFPLGLRGRDIPLAARLVAVAQCYALHVLSAGAEVALAAVKRDAGSALDPDLVEIFLTAANREAAPANVS